MTDETLSPPEVERTCGNCGCAQLKTHPTILGAKQLFCRLNPPTYGQLKVSVPLVRNNKVLTDREGNNRTEEILQDAWLYDPVREDLTCFSGWRPVGSLPGAVNDESLDKYMGLMRKIFSDMWPSSDPATLFPEVPPVDEDSKKN